MKKMLESDERLSYGFFGFGLVLALAAMVLGPLNYTNWSVAAGVTASFVAVVGMYFAFQSWKEPIQEPKAELDPESVPEPVLESVLEPVPEASQEEE